ncbi:MAG: M20/M25/M40 family metallo-hydrolase [Pseudomonadales bacterium]
MSNSQQPGYPTERIRSFVNTAWSQNIVPSLREYIRIPNKSPAFDPQWQASGHMDQAVNLLADWARAQGPANASVEIIRLPERTPLLCVELPSTGAPGNLLLYGHYDKQPEFDGWEAGLAPWEPVERDGRLYGRGGADDGYALFGSLTAIAALDAANIPRARCVLLIEGCEESGSFDLPFYVDHLKHQIGTPDLVICLDAECGNYEQLWVTTSLRGMLPGVLRAQVLTEGQHSGVAGGIVPSSFRLLRQAIERVENGYTGDLHDLLRVEIPTHVRAQAQAAANILGAGVVERFPWVTGHKPTDTDYASVLLRNAWEPSLATVGLEGAPALIDAGNTLRPGTAAKLVFRLPPSLDAEDAAAAIKTVIESYQPEGGQISFEVETPQTGWCAPEPAPWLETAVNDASQAHFGKPAAYMGMGGTIPFMKMLGDAYPGVQFLVTGVLGPQSNAHGPNEFLHLATARRLTACVARVIADHAQVES